jgi:hypothetical protein
MMKLSKLQKEALERLTNEWQSAYELGFRLGTLNSLADRGLAKRNYGPGSYAFPRSGIKFKLIKDAPDCSGDLNS